MPYDQKLVRTPLDLERASLGHVPLTLEPTMPTVETFSREMIRRYLDKRNLKFLTDRDGDFRVEFAEDEECGCGLQVYLGLEGKDVKIYVVRVSSDKKAPEEKWTQILVWCNTWNNEKRYPKAYLHLNQDDDKDVNNGKIFLEEQIDLSTGVHQELLDDFTDTVISASNFFWTSLHQARII